MIYVFLCAFVPLQPVIFVTKVRRREGLQVGGMIVAISYNINWKEIFTPNFLTSGESR